MITAIAFLAAAIQSSPPPSHLVPIFSADDCPRGALDRGEQGTVYWQVVIDPEGRVETCTALLSSGYKDLDDATCRMVSTRARFSPAKDENNQPIYATYRATTVWRINSSGAPPVIPPDIDLTINQAPEGVKLPLQFAVHYQVKPDGTASHCEFSDNWVPRSLIVPPPVLVDLACKAAMQPPLQPVRNLKNEPVKAMDGATVRFSVKP